MIYDLWSMIYDIKRSVDLRRLFDPVLHSSLDDLLTLDISSLLLLHLWSNILRMQAQLWYCLFMVYFFLYTAILTLKCFQWLMRSYKHVNSNPHQTFMLSLLAFVPLDWNNIFSTFDVGQYCYAIDFTDCFPKKADKQFPS